MNEEIRKTRSPKPGPKLHRPTFKTSRSLDFFSEKELTAQVGHPKADWPLVAVKELIDNALDACEDSGIAPEIKVTVDAQGITVADNGPGIPKDTVEGILDYSCRVSSREAYVSPTRGAQGNALKTMVAMPLVLDGSQGRVTVLARNVRHEIILKVDPIRQKPLIDHRPSQDAFVKSGSVVTLHWPSSASSILNNAKARFLQIAGDYAFLNPHLTLQTDWFGECTRYVASNPIWNKWLPCNPTSPHWYTNERFERLIAAHLSHDADAIRQRTVREFICDFHGLSGTAKQKAVLEQFDFHRANLDALRNGDGLNHELISRLLAAMKEQTRSVKPAALGVIGRYHLQQRFQELGCQMETFKYVKVKDVKDGVPWIAETAFAATAAAFDLALDAEERRIITGVNWSPAVAANPFRQLGHESMDSILQEQRAGSSEPVVFLLHLVSPRVTYTDRGKSAVVIDVDGDEDEPE